MKFEFIVKVISSLRRHVLRKWDHRSSGMLRSVNW